MVGWARDAPVHEADTEAAVAAARAVRERIGLAADQSPTCWLTVAEQLLNLQVVIARLPTSVSGAYLPTAGADVVFVNGAHPPVRQRFTLAHEIGHHELGHGAAPRVLRAAPVREAGTPVVDAPTVAAAPRRSRTHTRRGAREREANFFAGELLAPIDGLPGAVAAVGGRTDAVDLELVVRLAAGYGVSAPMVLVRLETAGLVTRERKVELAAACSAEEHLRMHLALGLPSLADGIARIAGAPDLLPRLPQAEGESLLARITTAGHRPAGPLAAHERALRRLLGVA